MPIQHATSADLLFGGKGIPTKDFKVAEHYGPPYEAQTKSQLEGGQALILPGGALLSDGVVLRTFSETNTPQMIVRANECFYDSTNHAVNSAGPIHMQTADGRFTLEGTGFYWRQTNSSLIISNNVHTTIQQETLQSKPGDPKNGAEGPESGPIFISSRSFTYDGASDRAIGVWRDNVHATGSNLVVNSGILTAEVPMNERQPHSLVAEQDVTVEYSGIHATGGRLNYAPDTGVIRLLDQATWQSDQREGRGEELMIDQTNHIFQVNRNAWLKLSGHALGESGFLSFSNSTAKASSGTNSWIEILCDKYEVSTNQAVFWHQVRLHELVDNAVRGQMSCKDSMTVTFVGTNELQTLTAEKDVVIEDVIQGEDRHFTGGRAFYTHTNAILEITQDPEWRSGLRHGKGTLIRINTQKNEMLVRGDASMRLPSHELAGQLAPSTANLATNRAPHSTTNEFAQIYCEEYTLRPDTSVFEGGVYATDPDMNWSCEKMTVQIPNTGTTNVIAEQNVVFDLMTQKGEIRGKGDRAVYSFGTSRSGTNAGSIVNELRLTGTPAILNTTNGTFQNPLVIYDRSRDKLTLPGGDYRIQGYAKAIGTNIFVLPNKKRAK